MFAHMLMFLSRAKTGCIAATRPRAPFLDCRGNKWKLPPPSYVDSYSITKQSNPFTLERRSGMSAHAGASRMQHGPVNRLASETSPYLLQHAHNPVEWFAWGQEAFEAARQKNVPIFLSIGYSTCHWCHVMAEESFEAEDVAVLLNKHFIAVKVDREERPDVDKVYMTYVQALHGGGGWPLSVFLTPQLDPFFGATYFPKEDANGRPGFKTVLKRIADVWQRQREDILSSSAETMRQLGELITTGHEECAISESDFDKAIDSCAASLASRFDSRNGGFSSAPKFPRPSEMALLLTQYVRLVGSSGSGGSQAEEEARKLLHMVRFTLQRMAQGGIYDHIGGGFARYSTDSVWLVPHFEKMLYDQAQLVQVYLDAFTITKSPDLAVTARGTLDYMIRNLSLTNSSDSSAFCAAEDADSVDPSDGRKKEGFFYVWTSAEVDHVLGDRVGGVFKVYYGIKPEGNCAQSDPHGQFVGKNVLHVAQRDEDRNDDKELEDVLAEAREKMFAARQSRSPPPLRDDKIIVAWNGMALSALARAGRVLMHDDSGYGLSFPVQGREAKEYLKWAIGLASFLQNHVWDAENEELFRIFSLKLNKAHVKAFSDDYALLIGGLLDLYAATGNVKILAWAEDLQRVMDDKFWDHEKGGYFQSSLVKDDDSVKLKIKEDYDGAEPSANSIAVSNLWRLAGLSGTERRRMLIDRAKACAVAFSGRLSEGALAMPQMCCSLSLLESRGRQVVIVGRRGLEDTESLINAAFSVFSPDKIIIHLDLNDDEEMRYWRNRSPEVVAIAEASGMVPTDRATAFVCQNFTCKAPTCDPDVLAATLSVPLPTRL